MNFIVQMFVTQLKQDEFIGGGGGCANGSIPELK